jgi:6-phosphogluconolactonase
MRPSEIHIFTSMDALADLCMRWLRKKTNEKETVSIALSGGKTPLELFKRLKAKDWSRVRLDRLKLFWGDERCVPAEGEESNFGNAKRVLLNHLPIPENQIFRIVGENDPDLEVRRYTDLLAKHLQVKEGFPCFDLILLGLGDDGHTASIFPGQENLFESPDWCAVSSHPQSGQKRITLTGSLINHANGVAFLVTGLSKSCLVAEMSVSHRWQRYPADHVEPKHGYKRWLLDEAAASIVMKSL